jgi:hypothetical protein
MMVNSIFCASFLTAAMVGASASDVPLQLANAGFESAKVHDQWSLHVYGAQPDVSLDTKVRHEGKQ